MGIVVVICLEFNVAVSTLYTTHLLSNIYFVNKHKNILRGKWELS